MKNNVIRLTETEFKAIIKEALTTIIKESSYHTTSIDVDFLDLDFENLQINDFFDEINYPESVSVEITYSIEPYDSSTNYGGFVIIHNYTIDYTNEFNKIMPEGLYFDFKNSVENYLYNNEETIKDKIYDDLINDESYYDFREE